MEFIVQKVGMSRIIEGSSHAVTLLKVLPGRVCSVDSGKALVAYSRGKRLNKSIEGSQKKYGLSKEFNRFAMLRVGDGAAAGEMDTSSLVGGVRLKVSFHTKGRGFSGVIKRWGFSGGPASHGSRFHRRPGSIGNREWPGRVQPGKKMAGHYGNEAVTVQNDVVSFDAESGVLVVRGSVPGFDGAYGRILVLGARGGKK